MVDKAHYRGAGIRVDVGDRGYRGFDEGRYYFKARVNEVLDTLGCGQVLKVVKPVMPVFRAIQDRGLGGWRGHSEGLERCGRSEVQCRAVGQRSSECRAVGGPKSNAMRGP